MAIDIDRPQVWESTITTTVYYGRYFQVYLRSFEKEFIRRICQKCGRNTTSQFPGDFCGACSGKCVDEYFTMSILIEASELDLGDLKGDFVECILDHLDTSTIICSNNGNDGYFIEENGAWNKPAPLFGVSWDRLAEALTLIGVEFDDCYGVVSSVDWRAL